MVRHLVTKEQVMRDWILRQVGCGYIYGATGWICTEERRKQQAAQYPSHESAIMTTGAKWDGMACFDCAQLTRRAMEQIGLKPPSGATSQYKSTALYQSGGTIDLLPAGRLAQLFRVAADGSVPHTGWSIGDGTAVDARGHKDGVIRTAIDRYPWSHYKLIVGSDENYERGDSKPPETETLNQPTTTEPAVGVAVILQPVRMRLTTDTTSSKNVIRLMGIGETADIIAVTRKGNEAWAHLQQHIGRYTYRGWACVEDEKTRFIQLPEAAPVPDEMLYTVTITNLSAAQAEMLIKAWPQAAVTTNPASK